MTQTVTVRDYFNALMTLMHQRYMSPSMVDDAKAWEHFKDIQENSPDRTKLVIQAARHALNDINKHCGLFFPAEDKKNIPSRFPEGRIEDENIAYISLPESIILDDVQTYARTGIDITTKLLAHHPAGAIVDLRNNGGGGCNQMMAAIAPLLDVGNFVGWADEHHIVKSGITWNHIAGNVRNCGYLDNRFPSCDTPNQTLPVAVLYGGGTCSSGEVMALILKGSPLSKSFGAATFGNSSGNGSYPSPFPDIFGHGFVAITQCLMADRNHNVYGDKIQPDVPCDNPIEQAIEWMRAFPR